MDELIRQISQKINVSEDQARQAVEMVVGFLKHKLPPSVAGQVEAVAKGGNVDLAGDAMKQVGDLFGGKK